MELLFAPENNAFTIALGLLFAIAILEGVGTLLGFAFIGLIDGLIPSIEFNAGSALDAGHPYSMGKIMSWLRIGRVPAILIFIAFLASFGLVGLILQYLSAKLFGSYTPQIIIVPIAFAMSLPFTRMSSSVLCAILPKDETSAISESSLIGHTGIIVLGTARKANAVQAKVKDENGKTHYIMVEPDNDNEEFTEGSRVLLVNKAGAVFKVIESSHELLAEDCKTSI